MSPAEFVGLGNFSQMLQDKIMGIALKNTAYYILLYVPPICIVSLIAAILVNRSLRGMRFFRSLFFLPNVTSVAVLAIVIWRILGVREDAPLNYMLGLLGIPPQDWFVDLKLAMPSVAGVGIWGGFGYYMVIWLAALQGVPQELYDSARVDGAEGAQLYWYVTLPLLRPTAAFIVVMTTIASIQVFGPIYMLTNGGPVYRTTTITYHIYSEAFNFGHTGYSSAVSIVLFLIVLGVTLIQTRLLRWNQEIY
jgi:multiple sugar transport system permease protein/alpha-1,4-digalacturonate transport system permease protein